MVVGDPRMRAAAPAQVHAGTAVDAGVEHDRRQNERDGQREQREQLTAKAPHPEDHRSHRDAEQRGHEAGEGQRRQERRPAVARVAVAYMPAPKNAPWPKLKYPE